MATVAAVTPCESRRLIPNRGRWQPHIDLGRGPGGWYWRLRLTSLTADVPTQWRGAFIDKGEALAAGIVNFNTICAIKDGSMMQRFEALALDPADLVRESVEK